MTQLVGPKQVAQSEYVEKQNAAFDLYLQGVTKYNDIAKRLNIPRAQVEVMIEEVKTYLRSHESFKEMGRERLHQMDKHYGMIIRKGWETVEELENGNDHDKIGSVLKMIADVEAKRQDALQKAGMYDDSELADMIAETERKTEEIKKLLLQIIGKHPETKQDILSGLKRIEDPDYQPEPVVINDDDVTVGDND